MQHWFYICALITTQLPFVIHFIYSICIKLNEKKEGPQKDKKGKPGQSLNGTGPPILDHTLENIQS